LDLDALLDPPYLWILDLPNKEYAEFEVASLWPHEKIAGFPRT